MPNLPVSTDFTGSGITEAQFKTAMTNLRGFLADLLGTTGTTAAAQAALKALFGAGVDTKTGAYTVALADRGKLLNCSGTWTLSLAAAATLGSGFAFAIRNTGAGVITIDPDSVEKIDGANTISVYAGSSALVVCTGSAWVTVGHVLLDFVKSDHGHNIVGSLCIAGVKMSGGASMAPGSTRAGSGLYPASLGPGTSGPDLHGTALAGTWRLLGWMYNSYLSGDRQVGSLWQRIS